MLLPNPCHLVYLLGQQLVVRDLHVDGYGGINVLDVDQVELVRADFGSQTGLETMVI